MNPEEQRIREFAYQIWQSEGCPHGQEERHWEMARKLVEAQQSAPSAKLASRARKPASKPTEVAAGAGAPASKPRAARATTKKVASPAAASDAPQPAPQPTKKPRSSKAKKDA